MLAGAWAQLARPVAPALGEVPPPTRWFDVEHLALVRSYRGPRYIVAAIALAVEVALPLLVAWSPVGRRLVAGLIAAVGEHRRALAAAVVALAIVVAIDVLLLPAAFWRGFLHERAYGLSTQGPGGWLADWVKGAAPRWLAAALIAGAGYRLIRAAPRLWPLIAGLAGAGLTALVVFAAPLVLEPLSHTTVPLEREPLRTEIEQLAQRADVRAERILVADASRRTVRQNAYVSGLGRTRRVVLYDNLLAQRSDPEILSVLAHELGHQRNADLARGTLAGAAGAVIAALALGVLVRLRMAAGRQTRADDPRAVPVLLAAVVALGLLSQPVQTTLSRRAEAAADHAALTLSDDPGTFIDLHRGLAVANLTDPSPPGWVRLLWATHPSPIERLARAQAWETRPR